MTLPKIKLTGINALNLLGIVAIVYLVVVLGETIKRNYDLDQQVNSLNTQISDLQDQKDQLSYNIAYDHTNSFRDREARSKLGLQLPGENVIIIPHASPTATPAANPATKLATKKSNLQQWFDFLSGRNS
jgi:cell division protein FtsB